MPAPLGTPRPPVSRKLVSIMMVCAMIAYADLSVMWVMT